MSLRKINSILILTALVAYGGLFILLHSEITFESKESKTIEDAPIFNNIAYFPGENKDVWMMRQSHTGLDTSREQWDRIAIVLDKTQTPKRARFMQLEPGPLEWKEGLPEKEFRVSCFMCHANGFRKIRANVDSGAVSLNLVKKARIFLMNLKMASYGRVVYDPVHDERDAWLKVPFRSHSEIDNIRLDLPTCNHCHGEKGLYDRGPIYRQQSMTIEFLQKNGQMPPLWFRMEESEAKKLGWFMQGLL